MIDQTNWKNVEAIVRQVIRRWDPYSLLESGAPKDEWDSEILEIVGRLNQCDSPAAVASEISTIFAKEFQEEGFGPEDCAQVGKELYDALKKGNFR